MTSDPARYLADAGERLLQIMRPFFEVPVALQLPDAYSDALLDPVTVLSGVCDGLLGPQTPPAATDGALAAPASFPVPRPSGLAAATSASSFPHDVSHTEAAGSFYPVLRSDAPAPAPWQSVGITSASPPARPGSDPRSTGAPDARPDAYAGRQEDAVPPDMVPSEIPLPATSGHDPVQKSRARRTVEREDGAPGARPPAELSSAGGRRSVPLDEPRDGSSPTYRPEQQVPLDLGRSELFSAAPRTGQDPAREETERDIPGLSQPGTVRLASGAGRLAAMLRAHAANQTEESREEADNSLFPAEDGDDRRDPAEERISLEEVVERLADELETEFVRTYGSSGV